MSAHHTSMGVELGAVRWEVDRRRTRSSCDALLLVEVQVVCHKDFFARTVLASTPVGALPMFSRRAG